MKAIMWSLFCLLLIIMDTSGVIVSEAEQLVLESSGELLPVPALVSKIEHDLTAIRTKFPAVKDVAHYSKWNPGKLIISYMTPALFNRLNSSQYGPIESNVIFMDKVFMVTFTKPYQPERLVEVLTKKFGVTADPDELEGGSSSITFSTDGNGKNTYVFTRGSGDCPAGCINNHVRTFTVDPDENRVELVRESGSACET